MVTLCRKSRLSRQNFTKHAAYPVISGTYWIITVTTYARFVPLSCRKYKKMHLNSYSLVNSQVCERREAAEPFGEGEKTLQVSWPKGIISCWLKPLFSSSQGHAIWDGDLIINWDLAGYHGEAFGTPSSSNMLSVSNHDFWGSLFGNPRCTLSF